MPPKSKYTKEEIAKEALELIREQGYDSLNARSLASRLGISTMPLFHSYENMDEIKKAATELGLSKYNQNTINIWRMQEARLSHSKALDVRI